MTNANTAPIEELLHQLTDTWNDGDAAGYADLFTEDADYITFFGLRMHGKAAIEEGHRELFRMPVKIDHFGVEAEIKWLADGVALIIVGGTSTVDGTPDPSRNSIITMTAVESFVGWRFASLQNTRVSDPRPAR